MLQDDASEEQHTEKLCEGTKNVNFEGHGEEGGPVKKVKVSNTLPVQQEISTSWTKVAGTGLTASQETVQETVQDLNSESAQVEQEAASPPPFKREADFHEKNRGLNSGPKQARFDDTSRRLLPENYYRQQESDTEHELEEVDDDMSQTEERDYDESPNHPSHQEYYLQKMLSGNDGTEQFYFTPQQVTVTNFWNKGKESKVVAVEWFQSKRLALLFCLTTAWHDARLRYLVHNTFFKTMFETFNDLPLANVMALETVMMHRLVQHYCQHVENSNVGMTFLIEDIPLKKEFCQPHHLLKLIME